MNGRIGSGLPGWLTALGALFLALLLAASLLMGREVLRQLDGLSTAETDNVQWNLSQGEVEHQELQAAAHRALTGGSLSYLRRRFDIFYSRVATYRESPLFAGLRSDSQSGVILEALQARLEGFIPLIDGPDAALQAALPDMIDALEQDGQAVRTLALAGISMHAEVSEIKRKRLSAVLLNLAWVVVILVAVLAASALLLWRLYRRGRLLASDSAESAARMEAMVTSSLDAILVVDTSGRIQGFNGAAESIFGYSRKEALGQVMADLIMPEEMRAAHTRGMKRFLRTGEARVAGKGRIQLEALHKSGRRFPVELSITPARSGQDIVFVSFLRDITDRLEAEAELKRARDDALAGEKAKANLLTVMSHEMRTPLNGVLGSIDLLQDTPINENQGRYLEAMRVSGDLLLRHVNDVLELSRLEAGAAQPQSEAFDLCSLTASLVESQKAAARSGGNEVDVSCALGASDFVLGDPLQIQRVLLNLIGNALKFTRDGAVAVEVVRQDSASVEFRVADTGSGIAAEDLERIFDDFVTLDATYARQSEGTGLGLAISRRMVEAMGGSIGAESEPGEGSLFWFTLPLPEAEPAAAGLGADAPKQGQPCRILVVEDNDINRLLLEKMLEKQSHIVTTASGGEEGVSRLAAGSFDLVFMDISMPGVDGIEAIRRIRSGGLAPGTAIVALTAHAAREDHDRIIAAGFSEVLTKPVSQTDLEAAVLRWSGKLAPAADSSNRAGPLAEFMEALGRSRAAHYFAEFRQDYKAFRGGIEPGKAMAEGQRQEAHRLAGSAAVLGLAQLNACLGALERAEGTDWDSAALDEAWAQAEQILDRAEAA